MEEQSKCEISINSNASLDVSRRDLVKLFDRISYLKDGLHSIEKDQATLQAKLPEMTREIDRLNILFEALFGEQIRGIVGAELVRAELTEERRLVCPTPGQIRLGMSEPTKEQMFSIMDAIKQISREIQGPAPKEAVWARVQEIGITKESFEEILMRLRRSGALIEVEGTLKLV
ncbi:MAG: hypothetical protein WB392_12410 [Methanotrichaceae archaeon]